MHIFPFNCDSIAMTSTKVTKIVCARRGDNLYSAIIFLELERPFLMCGNKPTNYSANIKCLNFLPSKLISNGNRVDYM